jgi:CheY-like chemotaxis protein
MPKEGSRESRKPKPTASKPAPAKQSASKSAPAKEARTGALRVLVVEDDRSSKTVITAALLSEYEVTTASHGLEALRIIKAGHLPDLVVTDVMMPELDGIEMVRRLRAYSKTAKLPIIILTAKADADSYQLGRDVGANDYLTKPLTSDRLLASVRRVLSA